MRVYYFLTIIIGLELIFMMSGMNTTGNFLVSQLGSNAESLNVQNLQNTNFFQEILIIIGLFGVATVSIGLIAGFKIESVILATFSSFLIKFLVDMVFVMNYAKAKYCPTTGLSTCWASDITLLIMLPLSIGFLFSIIAWQTVRD